MNAMRECIRKAVSREISAADKNVTKETALTRVLEKVLRALGKSTDDLRILTRGAPDVLYVHPQVSAYLSRHVPVDYHAFDHRERRLVAKIYSTDYHYGVETIEFCDLLDAKIRDPALVRRLRRAFAVDAYENKEDKFSHYVSNLAYPLREEGEDAVPDREKTAEYKTVEVHVKAVRELYENYMRLTTEQIREVVRCALNYVESDFPAIREGVKRYLGHVGARFNDVKRMLESRVLHEIEIL